jgi:hypothetical protein
MSHVLGLWGLSIYEKTRAPKSYATGPLNAMGVGDYLKTKIWAKKSSKRAPFTKGIYRVLYFIYTYICIIVHMFYIHMYTLLQCIYALNSAPE